jgi:hypothetical protein
MSNKEWQYETRTTFNGTEVHITGGTAWVVLSLEEVTADAESGSGYAQVMLKADESMELRMALELAEGALDVPDALDALEISLLEEENNMQRDTIDQLGAEVVTLRALIGAMAEGGFLHSDEPS